jgi:hypothetical protein
MKRAESGSLRAGARLFSPTGMSCLNRTLRYIDLVICWCWRQDATCVVEVRDVQELADHVHAPHCVRIILSRAYVIQI